MSQVHPAVQIASLLCAVMGPSTASRASVGGGRGRGWAATVNLQHLTPAHQLRSLNGTVRPALLSFSWVGVASTSTFSKALARHDHV